MNFKLVLLLVVFSAIALQESSAWRRFRFRVRIPRIRWRRILYPGPIGIMPQTGGWLKGRDVASNVDENEDGFLNEAELAKHLNERDIAELMEALDDDGDNLLSTEEFNNN